MVSVIASLRSTKGHHMSAEIFLIRHTPVVREGRNPVVVTDLRGQTTNTIAGPATFDTQGIAETPIAVAVALLQCLSFSLVNGDDAERINAFRARTDGGPGGGEAELLEDTGTPVRLFIPDGPLETGVNRPRFTNEPVRAPNNCIINFGPDGWGTCGMKTAEAMVAVYPDSILDDSATRVVPTGSGPNLSLVDAHPTMGVLAQLTTNLPGDLA